MIRFFIGLMLFSASINATQVVWDTYSSSSECGPQGPRGIRGPLGATGATGATGPDADPVPPPMGAMVGFGNGNFLLILGFNFDNGVAVISTCASSGDFQVTMGTSGPELVEDLFGDGIIEFSYNVPNARVLDAIAATFTFRDNLTATSPSRDIVIRAEVWAAPLGSRVFSPTGAGVDFPTINTSAIVAGTTIFADPVSFSIPVAAGSRLLMVISRTATPDTPNLPIFGGAAAGLHF